MRNWYKLAGILLFSTPLLGQTGQTTFNNWGMTVTCDASGHCYSDTTIQDTKPQYVTKITASDRDVLDELDKLDEEVREKQADVDEDRKAVREIRQQLTEDIIKGYGIKDPSNMTINGLYILYTPSNYGNWIYTSPTVTTPSWIGPGITLPGSTGGITY